MQNLDQNEAQTSVEKRPAHFNVKVLIFWIALAIMIAVLMLTSPASKQGDSSKPTPAGAQAAP